MKKWVHYIDEIRVETKPSKHYFISGITVDNYIWGDYKPWSYEVDSEGELLGHIDNYYHDTKLKDCINDYLVKQGGNMKFIFQSSVKDIIYHANDNGDFFKE